MASSRALVFPESLFGKQTSGQLLTSLPSHILVQESCWWIHRMNEQTAFSVETIRETRGVGIPVLIACCHFHARSNKKAFLKFCKVETLFFRNWDFRVPWIWMHFTCFLSSLFPGKWAGFPGPKFSRLLLLPCLLKSDGAGGGRVLESKTFNLWPPLPPLSLKPTRHHQKSPLYFCWIQTPNFSWAFFAQGLKITCAQITRFRCFCLAIFDSISFARTLRDFYPGWK